MSRADLIERILFAVDGYRFGEWSLADAGARITKLIDAPGEDGFMDEDAIQNSARWKPAFPVAAIIFALT